MMKIAMILPSLANKGPGIVVKELCSELIKNGHDCDIYYFDNINELKMPCKTYNISFNEKIDFNNYDIIHSHMFRPDLYVWWHLIKRKKRIKTKTITTLHNPIHYSALRKDYSILQSIVGSFLWKKSLKVFNHIVTLNEDTYNQIKKDFTKVSIIHNGMNISQSNSIDPQDKIKIEELKKRYKIIGSISGIIKRKGLDQIINALPYLKDFAFVAVGDGEDLDRLKKLSCSLNVEDRCLWLGNKYNAHNYNSYFDIFIMCSYSEGYPLALIEAAAYGKPTVLSNIKILKSIISNKEVVFYKLNDIEDLIKAIRTVDNNCEYFSENIFNYYKSHLTANIMTCNYVNIYNKL